MAKLLEPLLNMDKEPPKEELKTGDIQKYLESLALNIFTISFSVSESGVIDVSLDWPEGDPEQITEMAATLLFSLNSGLLKTLMIEAIMNTIEQYPESREMVKKVIENWSELENSSTSEPCIKPTDTLKNA